MPSLSENLIPWCNLTAGWQDRVDSPKADGLRIMKNVFISDRGGVATRAGTEIFGVTDIVNGPIYTMATARRRDGTNIQLRTSDTVVEYYNDVTASWALLKGGFTASQVFGFQCFNINTNQIDYVYFCNAIEPYQRWTMAFDATTAPLVGGETSIPVNTVLDPTVYFTGTASAVTTTTLNVATTPWANSIWTSGFYVRITSGAQSGQIRPISANTNQQLTWVTAIAGLAGTPTFEIRRLKFSPTGTAIINSSTVAYTQILTDSALPVGSAPAAASGSPVAQYPEELMSNSCPRGNILKTLFNTMSVAGVKSAPTTVFRSKVNDAADFTFSATRTPGQGDVVEFPDDGTLISDVAEREEVLEVFKESQIYDLTWSQDALDLAQSKKRVSSPYIGTQGRTFRVGDDIFFVSPVGEVTSLSRVPYRDQQPQRTNLAWPIKRAIRNFSFDDVRGYTYKNYSLMAVKASDESTTNDTIIVYDNNEQKWIGEWNIPAADFTVYNNKLYFGSSASREVYQMFTGETVQRKGENVFIGYDTRCVTQWINKTPDTLSSQYFTVIAMAGYIKDNTIPTFKLYFDFAEQPTYVWSFDPTQNMIAQNNILETTPENVLGEVPLGVTPLGVEISSTDVGDFGEKRFLVYWSVPFKHHIYASLSWETSAANTYFELLDLKANFAVSEPKLQQKFKVSFESGS